MIRFRQWSRKGYAIFASLGKHVTIGHACKSIAEASLTKTGWLDKPCLNRKNKTDETDTLPPEEADECRLWLYEMDLCTIVSPSLTVSEEGQVRFFNNLSDKKSNIGTTVIPVLLFFCF